MKSPASDENEAPRASTEASTTLRERIRGAVRGFAISDDAGYDDIVDRIMDAIAHDAYVAAGITAEANLRTVNETEDVLLGDLAPPLRSVTVSISELAVERSRLPYCRAWKSNGDQCGYRGTFLMEDQPVCGVHIGRRDTLFIPDRLRRR